MRDILIATVVVLVLCGICLMFGGKTSQPLADNPKTEPSANRPSAQPLGRVDSYLAQGLGSIPTDNLRILHGIIKDRANYAGGVHQRAIELNWNEECVRSCYNDMMELHDRSSKINDEILRREAQGAQQGDISTDRPYQSHSMQSLTGERDSTIASLSHFRNELADERRGSGHNSADSQSCEWQIFQLQSNLNQIDAELSRR